MEKADKGCLMIRMGVSGWMFLPIQVRPPSQYQTRAVKWLCVVCEWTQNLYKYHNNKYINQVASDCKNSTVTKICCHSCAAFHDTTSTSYITRSYNNGWVSVCLSVCLSHSCAVYLITTSTSYITRSYNNGWGVRLSVCLFVSQLCSLPHHH